MNDIQYLKNELQKDPKEIDWDVFISVSQKIKEFHSDSSFMGFKKGYVNLIYARLSDISDELLNELSKLGFKIFKARMSSHFLTIIKENQIKDLIKNHFIIVFIEKKNIESKILSLGIPYIKYRYSIQRRYDRSRESYHLISRVDGAKIRFQPENLLSMSRDYLMNLIFE